MLYIPFLSKCLLKSIATSLLLHALFIFSFLVPLFNLFNGCLKRVFFENIFLPSHLSWKGEESDRLSHSKGWTGFFFRMFFLFWIVEREGRIFFCTISLIGISMRKNEKIKETIIAFVLFRDTSIWNGECLLKERFWTT